MLVSNDTNIIGNIANNPDLLMKLTQLVVIFLIRDDADEAHNHDHIRWTLKMPSINYLNLRRRINYE